MKSVNSNNLLCLIMHLNIDVKYNLISITQLLHPRVFNLYLKQSQNNKIFSYFFQYKYSLF